MYYFAYGTNMSESKMRALTPFTKREGARLEGYRLVFNKQSNTDPRMGFANVVPDRHSSVEGVLYELDEAGLAKLDISEGSPDHYSRRELEVVTSKGKKMTAEVYIASDPKVRPGLRPSKSYMANLLAGADLLPKEYVKTLREIETYD
jgi:gamma-glutamylcyclotransferase